MRWIKAVLALLAIAALLWLVLKIGGFALDVLYVNREGASARDPQFAEEAETVTRPPELWGEEGGATEFKDNSANWDTSVRTPVDQTAGELEAEARASQ